MEWAELILFELGGRDITLIDLVSSLLGLTCVFLAGRNSKYNFWVGYLYTTALFFMFLDKSLYASLILQPVSLAINIIGHYRWTHPLAEEKSSDDASALRVSMLSWKSRIWLILTVLALAFGWGLFLDTLFPKDPHPYLDSVVTVLILTAQMLSAMKKWDCWILWLVVNVTQIILHISVGNTFMPVVCTLYLINGIWSIVTWMKLYRRKA